MRRRGFTLIELLVVVGIIVILISILVPVLSQVKNRAYKTSASALLNNLASDCYAYHAAFGAYPGPMGPTITSAISGKQASGAQNLLLGLSYGLSVSNTGMSTPVAVPGSPTFYMDANRATGPVDFGKVRFDGRYDQMAPFFSPSASQVSNKGLPPSPADTAHWIGGLSGGNPALPMIVDSYPDPLPVLYYRRSPGVERPVVVQGVPSVGGYYYLENAELTTTSGLTALGGRLTSQVDSTWVSPTTAITEFEKMVANNPGTPTATARGGFVLVSAGFDRIYGTIKSSATSGAGTNDDIVFVGGD